MTNEQKVRVDRLERYLIADKINLYTTVRTDDLDTVLSLIKEQQEEIEGLKDKEVLIKRYFNKCDLIKQKDKQIDLIIDEFYKKAKISTKCYLQESIEECMKYKNCKECLKQYFARLVEKE